MIMFNKLPEFIVLQGNTYKINTDFRNMIFFENKLQDKSVDNSKKIEYGLRHFYPAFFSFDSYKKLLLIPNLYQEACDKLIWFYNCGREDYHKSSGRKRNRNEQIYSYDYDDEYIWSAFHEVHSIDLTVDRVHWWKFKAILKSLPESTEFVKIQGYRAYDGKDENMKSLKEYWKLPVPVTEQERLNKLYEILK